MQTLNELITEAYGGWTSVSRDVDSLTEVEAKLPRVKHGASTLVNTLSLHKFTDTMYSIAGLSNSIVSMISDMAADVDDPTHLLESGSQYSPFIRQYLEAIATRAPGTKVRMLYREELMSLLNAIDDQFAVDSYDDLGEVPVALPVRKEINLYQYRGRQVPLVLDAVKISDSQSDWVLRQDISDAISDVRSVTGVSRNWRIEIYSDGINFCSAFLWTSAGPGPEFDNPDALALRSDVDSHGNSTIEWTTLDAYLDELLDPEQLYDCMSTIIESASRTGSIEASQAISIIDQYGPNESLASLKSQFASMSSLSAPSIVSIIGCFFQGKNGTRSSSSSVAFTAHSTPGYTLSIIGSLVSVVVSIVAAILTAIFHALGALISVAIMIISKLVQFFRDNVAFTQGKVVADSEMPAWNYPICTVNILEGDGKRVNDLLTFGALAYDHENLPYVVWYISAGELDNQGRLPCVAQWLLKPGKFSTSSAADRPYSPCLDGLFSRESPIDDPTHFRFNMSMSYDNTAARFIIDPYGDNPTVAQTIFGGYSELNIASPFLFDSNSRSYLSYTDMILEQTAAQNFYFTMVINCFLYWIRMNPNPAYIPSQTSSVPAVRIGNTWEMISADGAESIEITPQRCGYCFNRSNSSSFYNDHPEYVAAIALLIYDNFYFHDGPEQEGYPWYCTIPDRAKPSWTYDWVVQQLTDPDASWEPIINHLEEILTFNFVHLCLKPTGNTAWGDMDNGLSFCGEALGPGYPLANPNCTWPSVSKRAVLNAALLMAFSTVAIAATVGVVRATSKRRAVARLALREQQFEDAKEKFVANPKDANARKQFTKANKRLTRAWKRAGRAGVTMYNGFDTGTSTSSIVTADTAHDAIANFNDSVISDETFASSIESGSNILTVVDLIRG